MVNITSTEVNRLGFSKDNVIQEWLWGDDVDEGLRQAIYRVTNTDFVDEDDMGGVDGAIIWWRDGDNNDELTDVIMDALSNLTSNKSLWIFTPTPHQPGACSLSAIQDSARAVGMSAERPLPLNDKWNAIKLS